MSPKRLAAAINWKGLAEFLGWRKVAPKPKECPFCTLNFEKLTGGGNLTYSFRDNYPVSPGHTLIVPKRHVETFFDMTGDEQAEVLEALQAAKVALDSEFHPQGYNVGFNAGRASGQTVMHAHIHVIPRYLGDVEDPRGGVRHCIPGKGFYTPRT